jgi:chaperonin cofactor prefoldin
MTDLELENLQLQMLLAEQQIQLCQMRLEKLQPKIQAELAARAAPKEAPDA